VELIKKRKILSNSEIRELLKELSLLPVKIIPQQIKEIEAVILNDNFIIYLINKLPLLIKKDNVIFPSLFNIKKNELPLICVDEGAVSHIINGADIMAPGITFVSNNVEENSLVSIKSPDGNIISIGLVLEGFKEKLSIKKGKVIKNLHYKGDKLYKICYEFIKRVVK